MWHLLSNGSRSVLVMSSIHGMVHLAAGDGRDSGVTHYTFWVPPEAGDGDYRFKIDEEVDDNLLFIAIFITCLREHR
ncbi:hypothetical protein EDB83DRAFT_2398245 [Lactarius deliciosus]|nr:hypothetical protein EDB83DRAFT_2398245 [Lactarius deliciosus]